jgi:hypothetical protein
MALLLALMSIAQTPNITDFDTFLLSSKPGLSDLEDEGRFAYGVFESLRSRVVARSENDPVEDGDDDRVRMELERGECFSGELKYADAQDCRSCGITLWSKCGKSRGE